MPKGLAWSTALEAFPGVEPIRMTQGQRVRVRLVNVGCQAYSMHLHGHGFVIARIATGGVSRSTATAGIPLARWFPW